MCCADSTFLAITMLGIDSGSGVADGLTGGEDIDGRATG